MATFTLKDDRFPEGTSVGAYLRSQWPVEGLKGAPSGSAVATATVTSGQATLSGLADATRYVAYAQVNSVGTFARFMTDPLASGNEIAYAEATTDILSLPTTFTDIPGLSIAIPAGTGPYVVEFLANYAVKATAANGAGFAQASLIDEGAVCLASGELYGTVPTINQFQQGQMIVKRRMPATSAAKTIKVQHNSAVASATVAMHAGPGTGTSAGAFGPAYIQAYLR